MKKKATTKQPKLNSKRYPYGAAVQSMVNMKPKKNMVSSTLPKHESGWIK